MSWCVYGIHCVLYICIGVLNVTMRPIQIDPTYGLNSFVK